MARSKRSKTPKRPGASVTNHKGSLFVAALILIAVIGAYFSGMDRFWQTHIDAGDDALKRGNYEWSEKMYLKALQAAEAKGADHPLVAETGKYLKRLERVRSQNLKR